MTCAWKKGNIKLRQWLLLRRKRCTWVIVLQCGWWVSRDMVGLIQRLKRTKQRRNSRTGTSVIILTYIFTLLQTVGGSRGIVSSASALSILWVMLTACFTASQQLLKTQSTAVGRTHQCKALLIFFSLVFSVQSVRGSGGTALLEKVQLPKPHVWMKT